ncbi:MAG: hypothetical protein QM770_22220 [Tepidisphaeraceae bacterium]
MGSGHILGLLCFGIASLGYSTDASAGVVVSQGYYENGGFVRFNVGTGSDTISDPYIPPVPPAEVLTHPAWKSFTSDNPNYDYLHELVATPGTSLLRTQGRLNVQVSNPASNVTVIRATYGSLDDSSDAASAEVSWGSTELEAHAEKTAIIGLGGAYADDSRFLIDVPAGGASLQYSYTLNGYADDNGNVHELSLLGTDFGPSVFDVSSGSPGVAGQFAASGGGTIALVADQYSLRYASSLIAEAATQTFSVSRSAYLDLTLTFTTLADTAVPEPMSAGTMMALLATTALRRIR